jgi:hypothetical protein
MADIDWSQFKPVQPAAASDVDWSQFKPVASAPAPAVEQAPLGNPMGDDVSAIADAGQGGDTILDRPSGTPQPFDFRHASAVKNVQDQVIANAAAARKAEADKQAKLEADYAALPATEKIGRAATNIGKTGAAAAYKAAQGVALGAGWTVDGIQKALGLPSGPDQPGLQQPFYKMADAANEWSNYLRTQPEEESRGIAGTAEKVAGGLLGMIPDLAMMYMTKGAAPGMEAELALQRGGMGAVQENLLQSARAAVAPSVVQGINRAKEVLDKTGDASMAFNAGLAHTLASVGTMGLPMAAPGANALSRAATGGLTGMVQGDVMNTVDNAMVPDELKTQLTGEDRAVAALSGGILGAGMARPRAQPMDLRQSIDLSDGQRLIADAINRNVRGTEFLRDGAGGISEYAARLLSPDFANPRAIIPGTEARAGGAAEEATAPTPTTREAPTAKPEEVIKPVDPTPILTADDPVAAALESLPDIKVDGQPVDTGITPRTLPTEDTLAGKPISSFDTEHLQNLQAKLEEGDPTHTKITNELERRGEPAAEPAAAPPAGPDPVAENAQRIADTNAAFAQNLEQRTAQGMPSEGHPQPDLTPAAPEVVRALDPVVKSVAEVLGTAPVAVAHSPTLPDGINARGRTVINVDGLQKPAIFIVSHESIHSLQMLARNAEELQRAGRPLDAMQADALRIWAPMERAIWDMIPHDARVKYARQVMKLTEADLSDPSKMASLKDEMLADFGAKRLSNRQDLEALARREPAMFGEFANRMIDWISKAIDALKGKRTLGPHDIDKHIADLNSAKMMWRDALVAWKKRGGAEAQAVVPERAAPKVERPASTEEPAFSRRTPEQEDRSRAALKQISENADLFQYPKGQGTTLEEVAKSIDPRAKVLATSVGGGFDRYRLTLPPRIEIDEATGKKHMVPGGDVGIRVRKNRPNDLHPDGYYGYSSYDADPETAFAERPGVNADALGHKHDVIVDASLLKSGDNGGLAYAIAADFAKNNGHVFIGDPSGLSDQALVRRTEQMLSSALKHGTTDHIAPHPRQIVGDEKLGVAPLHWDYADPVGNIERMIEVARQTADNQHPVKFDFDPATGDFHEGGFSFDREGLGSVSDGIGGRGGAGGRTLARAALWRALLRGSGEEGEGGGGRDGVLEKLLQVAGQHAADRQALNRVFYSPRTEEATAHDETSYSLGPKALLGKARELPNVVMDMVDAGLDKSGIYKAVAPMSSGAKEARAVAQKFINEQRAAQAQWAAMTTDLMKRFTKPERKAMWNAADEQNTLLTQGKDTAGKGLDRLTPEQRAVVEQMHAYGERLWQMAQDAGMVKGEGVKYWTPRMMAIVDEAGNATEARTPGKKTTTSGEGRNITTTSGSLKQRKYETADETEAAMAAKGGALVRDIATMPLAMRRLENAIAGRQLINTIKEIGLVKGQDLVSTSGGPNFFTLDHPAFQTFRPELRKTAEGKWETVMRDDGTPVMQSQPLFISKEFEGPLRAVMSGQDGPMYRAYMLLKSKAMSAIMYSPLIHNMVIAGRAFAYAGLKLPALYVSGHFARADRDMMDLAIRHGLVPISGANHSMLDVGDIANGIGKEGGWGDPNESWISLGVKALGNKTGGWGDKAKTGLDKFGDFWHGTLLWDRVGDLQAGIFKDAFQKLQAKGYSDGVAATLAAHYANRYAGAVGREQMSGAARKWMNVLLFSRSFNVGNVGAVKDIFFGLPAGLRAQVETLARDPKEAKDALGAAKRKAFSGLVLDFAAAMIATSIYQDWKKRDQDKAFSEQLAEAGNGYAQRAAEMVEGIKAHPTRAASYDPRQLMSTHNNEPGKEDRIDLGAQPNSARHEYQRLPTGKVVEDTINWTTKPVDTFMAKMSPMAKSILALMANNKAVGSGFDKPVWDPDGTLTQKAMDVAKHLVAAELPLDQLSTIRDVAAGRGTQLDKDKLLGNFTGLSVSQGHPMGPEGKVAQMVDDRLKTTKAYVLDDIKADVKAGDIDKAIQRLVDAGFTQREAVKAVGRIENPATGVSKSVMKKFYQHANDDELETMDRVSK